MPNGQVFRKGEAEKRIEALPKGEEIEKKTTKRGVEISPVTGRERDMMIDRIDKTVKAFYGVLNK
jgi:hypothetical protein